MWCSSDDLNGLLNAFPLIIYVFILKVTYVCSYANFRFVRFISGRWYSSHGTERSIAYLLSNDVLLFSTYSYRLGWEIVNSIRMNTHNIVLALVVSFLPCRVSSSQLLSHRIRSTPSCFIIQTPAWH